jgi:hypothetical protein
MRLTLRTLLAYLDDILEPAQAKEIGDKLNESSFASSLVSRIREVMRRRRLTAPTLSGAGVGIDPNTVAEYLDNTLAPDGVADVEKICLESDVHLAEVAACHQILTLALGEPVEIPQSMRERMYALGPSSAKMKIETPSESSPAGGANGLSNRSVSEILSQAPSAKGGHRAPQVAAPRVEIPEYLRSHSNFKRLAGYTVVAVVAIGWAVLMFKDSPFRNGAGPKKPAPNVAVAARDAGENPPGEDGHSPNEPLVAATDDNSQSAPATGADETGNQSQKNGAKPKEVATIDLPAPDELEDDPGAKPKKKSKVLTPKAGTEDEPSVADKVEAANKGEAESEAPAAAVQATPPAKYVSSDGATLNYIARDERWFMLPRRAFVHSGDILAVPEPFQCALEVEGGKGLVTIIGGSWVRILDPTEAGAFGIEIKRGKFMVRPISANDESPEPLRMGVGIAGELWRLEAPSGSVVGVRIDLLEPNKLDQGLDKNAYLGAFYVSTGAADVTSPAGTVYPIKGPGWLQLPLRPVAEGERAPQTALTAVPKWMAPQALSPTAQNYARLFERKFSLDDSVELSLPDVAADPNPEIARMATECLGLIEAYGPLVEIMHRSQHEEARKSAIFGLRLWLTRSPDNKDLLKAELDKRLPPEDAETAFKLLWGFDADDARNLATSMQLIDWMGDPEIWIRELAFYHVSRLTDKRHDYRPNATALQLKSTLKRWRDHVTREKGLLPPQKPTPNP